MSLDSATLHVRPYRHADAVATLNVFLDAVQITASADYTRLQVAAWARPERRDLAEWHRRLSARETIVAIVCERVVGFSDVSTDGLIDMMFVAPEFGRRGVATALLGAVIARAVELGLARVHADVSVTARPFFERAGFGVVRKQHPIVDGVTMTNFHMERMLGGEQPVG